MNKLTSAAFTLLDVTPKQYVWVKYKTKYLHQQRGHIRNY